MAVSVALGGIGPSLIPVAHASELLQPSLGGNAGNGGAGGHGGNSSGVGNAGNGGVGGAGGNSTGTGDAGNGGNGGTGGTSAGTGNAGMLGPARGAAAQGLGPSAPMTPAQTLIGQRASVCYGPYRFNVEVLNADWQRSVAGQTASGNANWVVALVNATNLGTDTGIVAQTVELRDERGRSFSQSTNAGFTGDVAAAYGAKQPYDLFAPGITETVALPFEVAPDVQRLTLASSNFQCQAAGLISPAGPLA